MGKWKQSETGVTISTLHISRCISVTTTVVIGGGITGLSTLYYLKKKLQHAGRDMKLVLVEAGDTLGAKSVRSMTVNLLWRPARIPS